MLLLYFSFLDLEKKINIAPIVGIGADGIDYFKLIRLIDNAAIFTGLLLSINYAIQLKNSEKKGEKVK